MQTAEEKSSNFYKFALVQAIQKLSTSYPHPLSRFCMTPNEACICNWAGLFLFVAGFRITGSAVVLGNYIFDFEIGVAFADGFRELSDA